MTKARPDDFWSDREMLLMLHWIEVDGLSMAKVGKRLGRSKGAVAGCLQRVRRQVAKHDRKGIGNGSMPARWWWRDEWDQEGVG